VVSFAHGNGRISKVLWRHEEQKKHRIYSCTAYRELGNNGFAVAGGWKVVLPAMTVDATVIAGSREPYLSTILRRVQVLLRCPGLRQYKG